MRFFAGLFALMIAVVSAAIAVPGALAQTPPAPALSTPDATLAAALHCPGPLTNLARNPVLLVPGTGLLGGENWDWGYGPALEAQGFTSCTVDLPAAGMGDVQIAAEYVVYAIRTMAAESNDRVAIIGYSQGGLNVRWALKYWPDVRALVSDNIGIAPANHGADSAAALCGLPAGCGPSILQMSPGSKLLTALDAGPQTFAGIDYTVIYSNTDGTVIPPAPRSSLTAAPGATVSNISIQSICPASGAVHIGMPADGTAWAIALDALLRPGAADASRIGPQACGTYVPGVTPEIAAAKETELNGLAFPRVLGYAAAAAEPALMPYAAAPLPPNTGGGVGDGSSSRTSTMPLAGVLLGMAGVLGAAALRWRGDR